MTFTSHKDLSSWGMGKLLMDFFPENSLDLENTFNRLSFVAATSENSLTSSSLPANRKIFKHNRKEEKGKEMAGGGDQVSRLSSISAESLASW